jgi:hypothetical protein
VVYLAGEPQGTGDTNGCIIASLGSSSAQQYAFVNGNGQGLETGEFVRVTKHGSADGEDGTR